jgi:hypothetical protein
MLGFRIPEASADVDVFRYQIRVYRTSTTPSEIRDVKFRMAALTCTVRATGVLCTSENFANVRPGTNPISAGAAAAAADSRLSGLPAHETSRSDERAARVLDIDHAHRTGSAQI